MGKIPDSHRITIIVSDGFIDSVYTTQSLDIGVDIFDLDRSGRKSSEGAAVINTCLNEAIREQQKIY